MSIDDLLPTVTGVPKSSEEGPSANIVVIALRTRPFLPSELDNVEDEPAPERGVYVEGGNTMVVKLQVKKVRQGSHLAAWRTGISQSSSACPVEYGRRES